MFMGDSSLGWTVVHPSRRYMSADEDSGRWDGCGFRDGDLLISSRSKHGTTWLQMLTLLLIHQTRELSARWASCRGGRTT